MVYDTVESLFTGICNSIRQKNGTNEPINHQDIPNAISTIDTNNNVAYGIVTFATATQTFSIEKIGFTPSKIAVISVEAINNNATNNYNSYLGCMVDNDENNDISAMLVYKQQNSSQSFVAVGKDTYLNYITLNDGGFVIDFSIIPIFENNVWVPGVSYIWFACGGDL